MNKTTNGNDTYYPPNHDLTINNHLALSLTNSPLDFNNNINTTIFNTETFWFTAQFCESHSCVIQSKWLQLSEFLFSCV